MAPAADSPFVLLVESQPEPERQRGLLFTRPEQIISCREPSQVLDCLAQLDAALAAGRHVAGFMAYEAALGLEPKLRASAGGLPREHLVWFGVFEAPRELRDGELRAELGELGAAGPARVDGVRFDVSRERYEQDFRRIHEHIRAGDTYQVCQTFRCHFQLHGAPAALFERLRQRQRTELSALIETDDDYSLLSLSPELFFRRHGEQVELRPMKGTAPRGRSDAEDAALAERLAQDVKTRAENVMIVDLLRNDIGRLARVGSVQVPALFSVERYETLLQMTSTIVARVDPAHGLRELMSSLFPCGSVTGAPKLRTMQIISELEQAARGIFCGSIGYATPQGDACFNVAIRSLLITREGCGTLGVGSGIVLDSTSQAERDECLLKAEFLLAAAR